MILRLRRKRVDGLVLCFCIAAWFSGISVAWSQEKGYPSKTIEVVINAGPGGASDITTRIIIDELSRKLKVPVVITNLEGAGGLMGVVKMIKAKPDGYTLLSTSSSALTMAPLQSPNPPFNTFEDLIPIAGYGSVPSVFVVHKSSPFNTMGELIKYAKENPGKLTSGLPNLGRGPHLNLELLKKAAAVNIKTIPYKGTGEVVAALLGKHIDMLAQTYIASLPYLQSGETRALAITKKVPNSRIPTTAEIGYSKVNITEFFGFFISPKIAKGVNEKLFPLFEEVIKDPIIAKKLEATGVLAEYIPPGEFTSELKDNWDTLSKLVEEIGLKQK